MLKISFHFSALDNGLFPTFYFHFRWTLRHKKGGSRNLVGIAIQLSDSEQEKLLVGYSMLISPEKFDFGVE